MVVPVRASLTSPAFWLGLGLCRPLTQLDLLWKCCFSDCSVCRDAHQVKPGELGSLLQQAEELDRQVSLCVCVCVHVLFTLFLEGRGLGMNLREGPGLCCVQGHALDYGPKGHGQNEHWPLTNAVEACLSNLC